MILTNVDDYCRLLSKYIELLTVLIKIEEQLKNFEPILITSEQNNDRTD